MDSVSETCCRTTTAAFRCLALVRHSAAECDLNGCRVNKDVLGIIRALCQVEPLGLDTHDLGLTIAARYGFSLYDSMILASARLANCQLVYTKDLQHDQVVDEQLKIINPFSK